MGRPVIYLSVYICNETVPLRKRQDANAAVLFESERDEYDQECFKGTSLLCSLQSWTGWICSCLIGWNDAGGNPKSRGSSPRTPLIVPASTETQHTSIICFAKFSISSLLTQHSHACNMMHSSLDIVLEHSMCLFCIT